MPTSSRLLAVFESVTGPPTSALDLATLSPPNRSLVHRRRLFALFALVTAIFTVGFYGFLRAQPQADLDVHIAYAERIRSASDVTSPHFLFQLLLIGVHATGVSYTNGAAWLLGLCYGGMALLVARELERRGGRSTAVQLFLVVPSLLVASHVFLPTVLTPNLYYGYFVPVVYHSATQQLNKLFALWIYFWYCSQLLDAEKPTLARAPAMGALCILSALAKPSFLVAFLPASGLYALRDMLRRRWRHAFFFAYGIAAPSLAVLLWQAHIAYGGGGVQVIFAPFVVFSVVPTLYKLPASLAFPLVVVAIILGGRAATKPLRFVWLFTGLGLFATLGLAEAGENMMAGNFAWTGQTAVFLAYVESVLFLLTRPPSRSWRCVAWAVFAVHVACGIAWYIVGFIPDRPSWL